MEIYWLDTSTGFTGMEAREMVVVTGESPYQRRVKATMDNLDPTEESHVSSLDVDFSTGAPVAQFNAQCLATAMSHPSRSTWTSNFLQRLSVRECASGAPMMRKSTSTLSRTWCICITAAASHS